MFARQQQGSVEVRRSGFHVAHVTSIEASTGTTSRRLSNEGSAGEERRGVEYMRGPRGTQCFFTPNKLLSLFDRDYFSCRISSYFLHNFA